MRIPSVFQAGPHVGGPASFEDDFSLRDEHAVHEVLDRTGCQAREADGVRAGEGVDVEPVTRALRMEDLRCRGKTAYLHDLCVATDVDCVVAVGGVDDNVIGRAVARGSAEGACECDVPAA